MRQLAAGCSAGSQNRESNVWDDFIALLRSPTVNFPPAKDSCVKFRASKCMISPDAPPNPTAPYTNPLLTSALMRFQLKSRSPLRGERPSSRGDPLLAGPSKGRSILGGTGGTDERTVGCRTAVEGGAGTILGRGFRDVSAFQFCCICHCTKVASGVAGAPTVLPEANARWYAALPSRLSRYSRSAGPSCIRAK